jgi:uncharacterized membrane protein
MRKLGWGIMAMLALIIAAYAVAVLCLPGFGPSFVQSRRQSVPVALYAHLAGGAAALALGPWQFSTRLRARALNLHRWIGRSYVVAVLLGGCGALVLAPRSEYGLVTHLGFGLLAVSWLGATLQAYRRIRGGAIAEHQRWMTRSYALTLAAVTLRIDLPLSQVAGIPFPEAYQAVAWLCWVPNLIVAEWWFVPRVRGRHEPVRHRAGSPGRAGLR